MLVLLASVACLEAIDPIEELGGGHGLGALGERGMGDGAVFGSDDDLPVVRELQARHHHEEHEVDCKGVTAVVEQLAER